MRTSMGRSQGPRGRAQDRSGRARGTRDRSTRDARDYDELEDRYLRLKEAHLQLKKLSHEQDVKIRKMATKLVRLTADLKRLQPDNATNLEVSFTSRKSTRRPEEEDLIEELRRQVAELKKRNDALNHKVGVLRHQKQQAERQAGEYGRVAARTDSGLGDSRRGRSLHTSQVNEDRFYDVDGSGKPRASGAGAGDASGDGADPSAMEMGVFLLRNKLLEAEHALRDLEEENGHLRAENTRLESLASATSVLGTAGASNARFDAGVDRNLGVQDYELRLLRLETELQTTQGELTLMTNKYERAHAHLEPLRVNQERLLEENKQLIADLRVERVKSSRVDQHQARVRSLEDALEEADLMLQDERRAKEAYGDENRLLRKRLMDNAQDNAHAAAMEELRGQVETAKRRARDSAREARDLERQLATTKQDLADAKALGRKESVRGMELENERDELREQMEAVKAAGVNTAQLQRALVLVKSRAGPGTGDLDFLEDVAGPVGGDHEAVQARLVYDLRKTQELLEMQVKLNADLKQSHAAMVSDLATVREDYEEQLGVYAQQLDVKNDRIRVLEEELAGFLYHVPGKRLARQLESAVDVAADLKLADNENLFEVHVDSAQLDGNAGMADDGQYFFSFAVYDFETMVSPVMTSLRPVFNYTARYVVTTDAAFFEWMHESTIVAELHRARGMDYETVGTAFLSLEDVVRDSSGKALSRTVNVMGVSQSGPVGRLTYSLRVLRPMSEAMALFERRQGLLDVLDPAKVVVTAAAHQAQREAAVAGTAMLAVRVLSLSGVSCRRPCVYYQLYTYNRHHVELGAAEADEGVIEVNDEQVYAIPQTHDAHTYLATRELDMVVVDADDADVASFVGVASVPLAALVRADGHEPCVLSTATLVDATGADVGAICVEMVWENGQASFKPKATPALTPAAPQTAAATPATLATAAAAATATPATAAAAATTTGKENRMSASHDKSTALGVSDAVTVVVNELEITEPGHLAAVNGPSGAPTNPADVVLMYAFLSEWEEAGPVSASASGCTYNHRRVFPCPPGSSARSLLREALSDEALNNPDSELGVIEFVFVDRVSSAEVGVAFVPFVSILDSGDDLLGAQLDVVGVKPGTEDEYHTIGSVNVTVIAIEALLATLNV